MHKPDGKTHFSTWEEALERVEEIADALECNVSITLEDDGTYRFWGHGPRIATWMCGDKEDDTAAEEATETDGGDAGSGE